MPSVRSQRKVRSFHFRIYPPSLICVLAPSGTGFSAAFPGIVPRLLTLTSNFRVPFYRDVILAMGICSVSKESCSNILRGGPGQAITIVVGGAAESLSAHPGTADLTLRKRLGFIKLAIQHGCVSLCNPGMLQADLALVLIWCPFSRSAKMMYAHQNRIERILSHLLNADIQADA